MMSVIYISLSLADAFVNVKVLLSQRGEGDSKDMKVATKSKQKLSDTFVMKMVP